MAAGCLLLVALASAAASGGADAAREALRAGNAHFREGDYESALAAFAAAYDPRRPDPLLAYNLGATAHRLGRQPEAVLWYRRAELAGARDPWLAENLDLARRELAAPAAPRPGAPAAWAALRSRWLLLAGTVAAWTALGLLALRRGGAWAPAALAALAALAGAAALAVRLWGPQPAVLLAPCAAADGLAAGSEVWARPHPEGWRVGGGRGAEEVCPSEAVALLRPAAETPAKPDSVAE